MKPYTYTSFLASCFALLLAVATGAQQPLNTNLLQNTGFETGVGSWTTTRGSFGVKQYGSAVAPPITVSSAIAGGVQFVHCTWAIGCESSGAMEQVFDVSGNAADIDQGRLFIDMSGYFGGGSGINSRTTLRASYFNSSGGALTFPFVYPTLWIVDHTHRNGEATLMAVQQWFPIPVGTRSLKVELIAWSGACGDRATEAWADNLSARLLVTPSSVAKPLDTNLLDLRSFEGASIVNPATVNGGRVTRGYFGVKQYGSAVAPPITVSSAIAGGVQFVNCTWAIGCESYGVMEQVFDVSGNVADIDQGRLFIDMSGYFGGGSGINSRTTLRASYFNDSGGALTVPFVDPTLPIVDHTHRNGESTLLAVQRSFPIPIGTRSLKVELIAWSGACGDRATEAWADNLSAKLTRNPPAAPQIGANLIDNGRFEIGAIINPPASTGWRVTRGTLQAQPYGLPGLPFPSVSTSIGGGAFLARATSDWSGLASMTQTFDVSGHAAMIDTSQLSMQLEGYLGGAVNDADYCYLTQYYYSAYGALLGQDQVGPVTQTERNNLATLLFRSGTFVLPIGTRSIVVEATMARAQGGTNEGLLDNVRALLVPSGIALRFPGTNDDFRLGTGVNALPSGGPGRDVKIALAHDILSIEVRSPAGTFQWQPLLLGGNSFSSGGGVPGIGLPSLFVNPFLPSFFWLLDGVTPIGPFGPSVVIPGGNQMTFVVPSGLAGFNILLQALTLSPAAANGVYAASDGHEIRFQ